MLASLRRREEGWGFTLVCPKWPSVLPRVLFFVISCGLQAQTSQPITIVGPTQIRYGSTAQYSASVNGAPVTVLWSVDGFTGGTAATGSISMAGVYTPSVNVFAGHSVSIRATAADGLQTSASLSVKILNPLPVFLYGSVAQTGPGNFLLDVHGSGFVPASQLQIAGGNINTHFVSATELQSNIQLPTGTATVAVGILNPNAVQKLPVDRVLPVPTATLSPLLTLSPAGIDFGAVPVNTASTLKLTLLSSGTGPVTIDSVKINGTGFRLSGATLPVTLQPGAALTMVLKFAPVLAASATGQVTIGSNASNGNLLLIPIRGTGQQIGHEVVLSWGVPTNPTVPIAGYKSYRAAGGGSVYQLLNDSLITTNTFTDGTVQSGTNYDYYITSVDASGLESVSSNVVVVNIP